MLLVTFSGLDGCGKSTHVARTVDYLAEKGWRVRSLATARISVGGVVTLLRDAGRRRKADCSGAYCPSRHTVKQAPRTMQDPTAPLPHQSRRWPQIRAARLRERALFIARCLIYPLDCFVLRGWLRVLSWLGYTAVVCDRYVYDKIANLPRPDGTLARLIRRMAPVPDFAFVIDVTPRVARERRGEHPAGYHETKHAAYRRVAAAFAELSVIPGASVEDAHRWIAETVTATGSAMGATALPSP